MVSHKPRKVKPTPIEERELTKNDRKQVIDWCRKRKSMNLPACCKGLMLSHAMLMKSLAEDKEFHRELSEVFEELKHRMLATFQEKVMRGDTKGLPSPSHLKFLVEMIDSGTLLGGKMQSSSVTKASEIEEDDDDPLVI